MKHKGIKLDRSAEIIATDLQGTQASPFLRVLWYWTKSLAGVYVHKLALTLRAQRPQTGVAPSHLCGGSERVLEGGKGVAHSLLATSDIRLVLVEKRVGGKATYRHGAQVKDVPDML